jgi:hypothetical protein
MVSADGTVPYAVAEVAKEIVGTQALIPVVLVDRSGTYLSAKSEETLVAPSMRGKSLFHLMYEPLLAWANAHDVAYIWGFTPARNAFEREGFSCPVKTSQLLRSFSGSAVRRLRAPESSGGLKSVAETVASAALAAYGGVVGSLRRSASRHPIDLQVVDASPPWADELSASFVREWGGTSIHRSREYLDWRLFRCPYLRPLVLAAFVDGAPVGCIAFGVDENGIAAIVDIVAITPVSGAIDAASIVERLIDAATGHCRDMGAVALRCWHVAPHPFTRVVATSAKRLGWVHLQRGFDVVVKPLRAADLRSESWPFDRWYVTRLFTEGTTA